MDDVVKIEDRWYVLATSSRADDRTRVLKHGDTFGLFDRYGDIQQLGIGEQGLYHDGTRFLSHSELRINERRPLLLNSTVKEDNSLLVVDLTTPDLYENDALTIKKSSVHVFRAKLLYRAVHYEHLRIVNYGDESADIRLGLRFGADFADIFEVRGVHRQRRGAALAPERPPGQLIFGYEGLDGVVRHTRIEAEPAPDAVDDGEMRYRLTLAPGDQRDLYLTVSCEIADEVSDRTDYGTALLRMEQEIRNARAGCAEMTTSHEQFNDWLSRSLADLQMLTTQTRYGRYPYAGVPWFSTAFGRDGIITALQMLWVDPGLAHGVLAFLAHYQAGRKNTLLEAEPGKILHEMRGGEMAALGEVPFGRYYGSIDSTPLFVVLAGAYYDRTGDLYFIRSLWPHITRALAWVDECGDIDGDGFVEYQRTNPNGLLHQGWKDSEDSVFHADGTLAQPPIALCEVQAYVYGARVAAARLARLLGHADYAAEQEAAAESLKERFNRLYWSDELGTYTYALDGDKRRCQVATSNAGHTLFTGIAEAEYARKTAELLVSPVFFNGWGVRTLAKPERRYNPMSYHNGSVWPHDNGIVAMGMARYGHNDKAQQILTGLFHASISLDMHRLPELYCGFDRLRGQGPTLYPVACLPQAWASGSVFHVLQACLGLRFSAEKPQLRFDHPRLPEYLERVEIRNLAVGGGKVDLNIHRHPHDVGVEVVRKQGDIEIVVIS
jgi:glycogen debranching enzyme